jgi:hypothetical protein
MGVKKFLLINLALLLVTLPYFSACTREVVNEEGALPTVEGLEQIQITGLRLDGRPPASLETINATGFDPDGSLWVRFFNDQGFSVDCPAIDADSTSITVSVPPFIDLKTGEFASGVVSVQIFQKSETATLISNVISGFQIEDLPSAAGKTGDATIAYLNGIIQLIDEEQTNLVVLEQISGGEVSSPELYDLLNNLRADYIAIKSEVESVIADPNKSIAFAKIGDNSLELNIGNIRDIDRLVTAVERQAISGATTSSIQPTRSAGAALQKPQSAEPHIVLSSRPKYLAPTLLNAESDNKGAYSLKGQSIKNILKKVETWGGFAGAEMGVARMFEEYSANYHTGDSILKKASMATWIAGTVLPASLILCSDLMSTVATSDKDTSQQPKDRLSDFKRFGIKIAPGIIDNFIIKAPVVRNILTIYYLENAAIGKLHDFIAGPDWGRTGGIPIADVFKDDWSQNRQWVEHELASNEANQTKKKSEGTVPPPPEPQITGQTHSIIIQSGFNCLVIPEGAGTGYGGSGFGAIPVAEHSDICFRIISPPAFPENNFQCPEPIPETYCQVYVDGFPLGSVDEYCFTDVTEDHTIGTTSQ